MSGRGHYHYYNFRDCNCYGGELREFGRVGGELDKVLQFFGGGEMRSPMSGHFDQRHFVNDVDCNQCDKHTNDSNHHFSDLALIKVESLTKAVIYTFDT